MMKFITVTFFAIVCVSQIQAHPGFWDIMGSMTENFNNNVELFLGGSGGSGQAQLSLSGDTFSIYLSRTRGKFDEFKKESKDYFIRARDYFVEKFSAAKRLISRMKDDAKPVFLKVQKDLQAGSDRFEEATDVAERRFGEWSDKSKSNFNQMASDVQDYKRKMEEKARSLSSSKRTRAQQYIFQFEEEAAAIMEKCRIRTHEPIHNLYESSRSVVEKAKSKFNSIVNDIRDCSEEEDQKKCGEQLYNDRRDTMDEIEEEGAKLKNRLTETNYESLAGHVCIADTNDEIRRRSQVAQSKINSL